MASSSSSVPATQAPAYSSLPQPFIPSAVLIEPTTRPFVPSAIPIEPTTQPLIPSSLPIEPTTRPLIPSSLPIEPPTQPFVPSALPIEPTTTQPLVPSSLPIEPTTKPFVPSAVPFEPTTTQPLVPSAVPFEPTTTQPLIPSSLPIEPTTTQPLVPSSLPIEPATQPFVPSAVPIEPTTTQPLIPSSLPIEPTTTQPLVPSSLPIEPPIQTPTSIVSVQAPPAPMHKNHLQEFTMKSGMALPVYETVYEGHQGHHHAPKFRSTVLVDGMTFTSQVSFLQRKAAEQEAARLALEGLTKKIKEEAYIFASENATLCKSILNEYASKLNIERPKYNTIRQEGVLPVFVSSLIFNGTTYTGNAARSKKDAEQSAAHAAVLSILGNSDEGIMIFQMIKSKSKCYDAVKTKGLEPISACGVSTITNTAASSIVMDHKDKEVADPVGEGHKDKEVADPVGENHKDKVVANPVGEDHKNKEVAYPVGDSNNAMLSTCQQSQLSRQEPTPDTTKSSNESQQPGTVLPIENGSSSKKRRKNKYKANKRARLESELIVAGIPVSQAPSCPVAQ